MKRRSFLLSAAAVGGTLVIGWGALPPRSRIGAPSLLPPSAGRIALNAWVRVGEDGTAVLAMPRVEMGQGVHTALPMLLAEELRLPLSRIAIERPADHPIYGNVAVLLHYLPLGADDGIDGHRPASRRAGEWLVAKLGREIGIDITAGSSSVTDAWPVVRLAGATARQLIVEQAAREWRVPAAQCALRDGMVTHPAGHSAAIGAFVAKAAGRSPEATPMPTPREAWRMIGRALPRTDVPAKTDGTARFGIDARPPGLLFAAVRLCPVLGGDLARLDEAAIRARPGVVAVVALPAERGRAGGFAVVASDSWSARRAADAAVVEWHEGQAAGTSSADVIERLRAVVAADAGDDNRDVGTVWRARGDVERAFAAANAVVESRYDAPFLAHAALEPPNATPGLRDGRLAVWAPTQVPGLARRAAADASGLSTDRVALEPTLIGGSFGRRLELDVVRHAARVALAVPGRPVQALWSREDDLAHDAYRPAQAAAIRAAVDADGRLLAWRIRTAGDSATRGWLARNVFDAGFAWPDKSSSEGLFDQTYDVAAAHVAHVSVPSPIPVGHWRSVGHSFNAFFVESFIDELAIRAGADPLRYRLEMLAPFPRHRTVLELAADRGGWHAAPVAGRARGLAMHESYGTIVAMVADVGLGGDGSPRVYRVTCAIDCGTVVNPGIVAQQVEGSVVFALGAALYGRIDVERGRVLQRNFPSYRLPSLAESPQVDTHIVSSARPPAGVGEPGVPPVAPAVANALFALTGRRRRTLPFDLA